MSGGFVKLYGEKLLDSSVWIGTPHNVKILWIAMLALADAQGRVIKGLPGLAHRSDLSREEVEEALEFLKAPDPDSQTPDFEGRRVEEIDGGWQLLTYQIHREYRTENQEKERIRKAEWRKQKEEEEAAAAKKRGKKKGVGHVPDVPSCPAVSHTEADAEAEADIELKETDISRIQREPKPNWLTPYAEAWIERMGKDSEPPYGRIARAFKKVHDKYGSDFVVYRFKYYLAENEPKYCSPERFIQTFDQWDAESPALPAKEFGFEDD